MGRYLDRLRADFSEKCPPPSLTEPTKAPSVGFVSTPPRRFPENNPAANDDPDAAAVLAWLAAIGETDPATITELRALLSGDLQARDYFVRRAREFWQSLKGPGEFLESLKKGAGARRRPANLPRPPEPDREAIRRGQMHGGEVIN